MSRDPYEGLRHALTIIPLIRANQGLTVEELAARTGLTEEQITEELSGLVMMCGIPPYAPNNYVSFWVEDGRVFIRFADQFERPVRLVLQEALALLLALKPLEAGNHPYRDAVGALRRKILDVLGPENTEQLGRMQRTFHLESKEQLGDRFARLRRAMARCQELRIEYWSAHRAAISERVIRPYGMAEHGGDWYVIAHDSVRQRPVTFRVDRIRSAELLDSEFEIPDDFDIQQWGQDHHFVPPPGDTVAEVLFHGEAARFAREDLPRRATEMEGGALLARVRVNSEVWFLTWLLQFGRGAEVLGPPELREKVRDTCRRILDFYDQPLPAMP